MKLVLRNALALIAAFIIGSLVNMAFIMVSGSVIPPPNGADVTMAEGLKATMHLFEPKHFIFPFLAHAVGTFIGAYVAGRIASRKMLFAMLIGIIFLIGGIVNVLILPSPAWFSAVDLLLAYLPMAYLAGKIAE
jgi:uncharacterized membrane protein HdeD (DUF308 family)